MTGPPSHILTITCPDTIGIVHAVSGFLSGHGCNIVDSAQFSDPFSDTFFMRITFTAPTDAPPAPALSEAFGEAVGHQFNMTWELREASRRPRVLIMVSRLGHCLNDLLYRYRTGGLFMDLRAIVSNHRDSYQTAALADVPFHHLPVAAETKAKQERRLMELIEEEAIDLVVLARYMQVLSPELCRRMTGRIINIHHSFLPSFVGAKPYHQAYVRGVKLIGATAHYVTEELDQGPIIEQATERVHHAHTPEMLAAIGRDLENMVLARAVDYHLQHRVLISGSKTVVF